MIVYLIEKEVDYEPGEIVGLFSTRGRAEKVFAKKAEENSFDQLLLWRWRPDINEKEVVKKAQRRG